MSPRAETARNSASHLSFRISRNDKEQNLVRPSRWGNISLCRSWKHFQPQKFCPSRLPDLSLVGAKPHGCLSFREISVIRRTATKIAYNECGDRASTTRRAAVTRRIDGYRYQRVRKMASLTSLRQVGQAPITIRTQFVEFRHSRHAYLGRFSAATILEPELMPVRILLNYEFEFLE